MVRGDKLVNNQQSQLLVMDAEYSSESNCFDKGPSGQLIADFFSKRFKTLAGVPAGQAPGLHSTRG